MKHPKATLTKPCRECPFMLGCMAGWLGPFDSPEELHLRVHSEVPFSCHMTVGHDDQPIEETELCVGSLLYMKKTQKMPRPGWLRDQWRRMMNSDYYFQTMTMYEFLDYHKKRL